MQEPLVISGLGGSGTRVIVRILEEINFSFGYDVNISKDDLAFTFLFKLPQHYFPYFDKNTDYVRRVLHIHNKLLCNKRITLADFYCIIKIAVLHRIQFRRYKPAWVLTRIKNILTKRSTPSGMWGWKEPHNVLFLPDIKSYYPEAKLILTIRNGLDMIYSKNSQQFHNYANYFGLDEKDESPQNRLELWYRFNKYAIEKGKRLFKDKFLVVYYEDVVDLHAKVFNKIFDFIGDPKATNSLANLENEISDPGTIGRYKEHDTSWIDSEVKSKLKEIGYPRGGDAT